MKSIGTALFAALVVVACASTAQPSAPAPTLPPATQQPSDLPATASPSASVDSTSQPTIAPEPTMTGEFPGPRATVPPGTRVLANLRLQQLADLWASLGLSCQSHWSGGPESAAGYNVHCEGGDVAADEDVVAEADYWTLDGLVSMSVIVVPSGPGSIDARTAAIDWVFPFARLAGGEAAVTWVEHHIGDTACHQGCTEDIGGSQLSYDSGSRGGQELFYVVRFPYE